VVVLLVVVAAAFGGFVGARWGDGDDEGSTATSAAVTLTNLGTSGSTVPTGTGSEPVADVAAALLPSMVQIETRAGLGSGVIYDSNGYIVTAGHVVEGATVATVRLGDGSQLQGQVVGVDTGTDVGVLKVDRTGLPAASMAADTPLRVGQLAVAIGSPFGLSNTVTSGVISAVQRAVVGPDNVARNLIQTDAAINPGNSGGALAVGSGQVIGICDSIFSTSGGNEGVGFAIPIKTALSVAEQLAAGQTVRTPFMGVGGTDTTSGPAGALITEVIAGSAAASAGLQVGDVVTAYNGQPVTGFVDLAGDIRSSQPGDTVTLTVSRLGAEITMQVVLGEQ
jgi:putative serine protease PepD